MNADLDILFLGRLFPRDKGDEIRMKAKVDMQDAANVLQWNLINGLRNNGISDMHVVSLLPIDSWPKYYKDAFIPYDKEQYHDNFVFETVSFCNITYVKQVLASHACDKAVCRWAKEKSGRKKVIICYSANNVLMRAVAAAKKINQQIEAVQVIADITEFATNAEQNCIRKAYTNLQIKKNDELFAYIDKFVLLTEHMKDKLKIKKPYIVMEGIVPERKYDAPSAPDEDVKTILYTGSMNTKYGIVELLEAFAQIPYKNYRLLLCGLGNGEELIQKYCQEDRRIEFLGKVPHDEVLKLQQQATVLINPRQNKEEFTKYSFPSKTMEYLASGVPLIAYKLDGIPQEYHSYINYVEDNSPIALAEKIMQICEKSLQERMEMGERAKRFVTEEKNAIAQTKRIVELIEKM